MTRILISMHDQDSGLDLGSFRVTADFTVNGVAAGTDLAPLFKTSKAAGVWALVLKEPLAHLGRGMLTVSIRDRQGNESRIDRAFSVTPGRKSPRRGG